ncbi:hypothetical protein BJX66DRAFT_308438 [Aspergillus keveii]|uniref:Uncharacterized protein n=1 Tax=Aspergillus keveii TaxID=714993 RepID=A0ABR4FZB2_9EURO
MVRESVKEKIRSLLHPSERAAMSDTDSIAPLFKKEPKKPKQTPEVAPLPYNGDQCFGSCCRGRGYPR